MKSKQPKNVPADKDWPASRAGVRGVNSFGRHMKEGPNKAYTNARGTGAATKGKKFLKD